MILRITLIVVLLLCLKAIASDCSSREAMGDFLAKSKKVNGWSSLKSLWKNYEICDDGVFGEEFSYQAEKIFKIKSNDFFAPGFARDTAFLRFIKKHIDETWSMKNWLGLYSMVQKKCPRGYTQECIEIKNAMDANGNPVE